MPTHRPRASTAKVATEVAHASSCSVTSQAKRPDICATVRSTGTLSTPGKRLPAASLESHDSFGLQRSSSPVSSSMPKIALVFGRIVSRRAARTAQLMVSMMLPPAFKTCRLNKQQAAGNTLYTH
eukprot:GHVT01087544.1.p2 GENE.GHVT01087544.1~~GHVT01087544.1.p2  ORF type:complete len:125 (+),score=15.52 GHVT01087544.1:599-973(+)